MDVAWARDLACRLLADPLPRRWAHSQGVGAQAERLAPIMGENAELLQCAALLHDIGYSPLIVSTGFHPLDGARYLRDVEHADPRICNLVAHHTCAIIEAEERSLDRELSAEFQLEDPSLVEALTYCDTTTTPDGEVTTVEERINEIFGRYGPGDIVTRSIQRATPHLIAASQSVLKKLEDQPK
ncbi:HD domain-containing protein [Streptomyces millisiae]|uniref:HD domain-containing protein n=1 Tax=Streptomyces millisiae TaxID=3075542 RepID=A0ABU2LLJ1_9ACTN|nr:HD domain-containing protein [Streptomyces sp. DSM 44918]MDT0317923.1 HD domain-containing protein [Streptomyces sp. DSM 44918]